MYQNVLQNRRGERHCWCSHHVQETMSLNVGRERMLMVEVYGRGESALSLGKVLETGTDEQMVSK